jgi:transposase
VVFFKLQLIEIASLNLAHRRYLGCNLDELLPDHSRLSRIRQRLGLDIFRRFFDHVVGLCQEAGLVWGRSSSLMPPKCGPMQPSTLLYPA